MPCPTERPNPALSAAFVRSASPGRRADGNGPYLFVQPAGTRSWIQRLVIRRRRRELGLGAAGLARPVSEVNSADVLEILTPIWHVKPETARAVRQRVRTVLEWAIAMEMRMDNPCDRVLPVLGPQGDIVEHMRALAHQDVAAAVERVRSLGSAAPTIKLAFEFLVLTAARSGEVRLATWAEMDVGGRVWTISAARMKAKREHRVPLCQRAVEILEAARTLGEGSDLVFPMRSGRPIAASTLPKMLRQHGVAAVAHGFRSSFRDWAAEETDHPREVIEAALAHVVRDKVEAAYARSDLFARRRRLMNDWAAYLTVASPLGLDGEIPEVTGGTE